MSIHDAIPGQRRPQLHSLTGLRFAAAAIVFVFHGSTNQLFASPSVQHAYTFGAFAGGTIGVSLFFILSGFVLTWSARQGDKARTFWRRRFFKIYPNHFVTFLLALALMALVGTPSGFGAAISNLFLVQSWSPEPSMFYGVNAVSWSLSAEALFYLSFPLLIMLVRRIQPSRLWWWAGAVTATVIAVPWFAHLLLPDTPLSPWGPSTITQYWFVYVFPVTRALEFILGILVARLVMSGRWVGPGVWTSTLLVVVGYVASLWAPFLYGFVSYGVIPLALLIPAFAKADINGRRTVFSRPWMVKLGELSFAFYLLHWLVLKYGHLAVGGHSATPGTSASYWSTPTAIAFLVAGFGITLVLSWALYTYVELLVMRRWSRSTTPVNAVTIEEPAPAVPVLESST